MDLERGAPGGQWRVSRVLPLVKLVGAAVLVVLGLLLAGGDPIQVVLAAVGAVALTGWALRDLLVPVRLAVDAGGVTVVHGFAGRRRLDWSSIESIAVDDRARRGRRSELLEIDAGDSLYLLSRYDLDASPSEVAAALRRLRP